MQVSRIWQEIADQKTEKHGSSIGSNMFSPFYFNVIILSCSVINCNKTRISPIPAGALFIDTVISPTSVLTVYTWKTEACSEAVVGRDYQHLMFAMLKKIMCT